MYHNTFGATYTIKFFIFVQVCQKFGRGVGQDQKQMCPDILGSFYTNTGWLRYANTACNLLPNKSLRPTLTLSNNYSTGPSRQSIESRYSPTNQLSTSR